MEKLSAFLTKLSQDSNLWGAVQGALNKAGNLAEGVKAVKEIASAAGFDVSAEELQAAFKQMQKKSGELTDDELGNVAGGLLDMNGDINIDININIPTLDPVIPSGRDLVNLGQQGDDEDDSLPGLPKLPW